MVSVREGARIENPRDYESRSVQQLRSLLEAGSPTQKDPRRQNFYEVDGNRETFYIHISPVTGNVVLLAVWSRQPEGCCLGSEQLVA
jgi:hypothetical protein